MKTVTQKCTIILRREKALTEGRIYTASGKKANTEQESISEPQIPRKWLLSFSRFQHPNTHMGLTWS